MAVARFLTVAAAVLLPTALARAAAPEGEVLFQARCAVCHPKGDGGGQGPGLGGVVGRKAAVGRGYGYSKALRDSGITWDEASLDRFLAGPSKMVPGTRMPVDVPGQADRRAIIAYLKTLPAVSASPGSGGAKAWQARSDPASYLNDAPGLPHHIDLAKLPAPYATRAVRNAPVVRDRRPDEAPAAPAGFTVQLFADGLDDPRLLRTAPNGDVFLAESASGRVRVLRSAAGANRAEEVSVFAKGLDHPFGIAWYPPGPSPSYVYVANTNSVVRFPYQSGDAVARGPAETVVHRLTRGGGGHWTRDLAFSADGRRMFVSVGSGSNVAEDMPKKSGGALRAWSASHALGAAWGDEEGRADVRVFSPEGKDDRVFAAGIRNCVGLAVSPGGDLWCSTNERDGLGDDLVPDYVTRVHEGDFFGWPWWYLGSHEEPRLAGERPDLRGRVAVPDVPLQAHSASLEMVFYTGTMFPEPYRGDAFAAFHGSWNRSARTGYKVVRIRMKDGAPTGEYEDFLTGFGSEAEAVWGRPVGVAVANDGALLVSEDGSGTVWRVAYGQ